MKRLALMAAVILLFTGCDATQKALNAYQKANPDKVPVGVDEDGDALTDVFVQTRDGKILVDADGKPLEVVGTREALALAKADDSLMSDELVALAVVIGIPGLTYLGRLWGRVRPMQRVQLLQTRFKDTVRSVQLGIDALPKDGRATFKTNVGAIDDDTRVAIYAAKIEA